MGVNASTRGPESSDEIDNDRSNFQIPRGWQPYNHTAPAHFGANGRLISGFSTASEPSARHLAELREAIVEHAVAAIFVGETVNPQAAQTVADDLGIVVGAVYTGSLSGPDGPAATYQDFIRTNVERIVAAPGSD